MKSMHSLVVALLLLVTSSASRLPAEEVTTRLRYIGADAATASSRAVVVTGEPSLGHTAQLHPLDDEGNPVGKGRPDEQVAKLLEKLTRALAGSRSGLESLVKLNVYVRRDDLREAVTRALTRQLPATARPAVTFVTTPLPHPEALVALDAVFVAAVKVTEVTSNGATTVMPHGQRIYVSGQAEKGADLRDATRKTLESLRETLKHMRLTDSAVVQVKAFFMPMSDAGVVLDEIISFYGKDRVPPVVLVEWKSSPATPIEIELIAYAGKEYRSAPDVVEYVTPPRLTASPIFSRVCRVWYGPSIYVSGIYATKDADAKAATEDVLEQLKATLAEAGSDLKHLVKATYYVATDEASKALNEVRPRYYDPKRPPAASKAIVAGVARPGRALVLDMIAVPTMKVPETPPEVGHGLTPQEAAEGWISLFDGRTTFGWKDAAVEEGVLTRGVTTARFGNCELRAEVVAAGALKIGGKEVAVKPGTFTLKETGATGPIELLNGVKLKSLVVKPLGLKPLFDGSSLDGWKRIDRMTIPEERRPKWRVEGGAIVATGGPGALEYQGGMFGDFMLQIDVKTRTRHANGGVFVRSIPGDFMNGYEAQVYNRCEDGDPSRPVFWATGALDDRQNARRLVSRDFVYYRMTVQARGPHLTTWINGVQVTDWTDTRPPDPNARKGLRVEPGTLQLQAHDVLTDVEFRTVLAGE